MSSLLVGSPVGSSDFFAIAVGAVLVAFLVGVYFLIQKVRRERERKRRYEPGEFDTLDDREKFERESRRLEQEAEIVEEIYEFQEDPSRILARKVGFATISSVLAAIFIYLFYMITYTINPWVFVDPALLYSRILVYVVIGVLGIILATNLSAQILKRPKDPSAVRRKTAPWSVFAVKNVGESIAYDAYRVIPWVVISMCGVALCLFTIPGIHFQNIPGMHPFGRYSTVVLDFPSQVLKAIAISSFILAVMVWERLSIFRSKKRQRAGLEVKEQDADLREVKFFLIDSCLAIAALHVSWLLFIPVAAKALLDPLASIVEENSDLEVADIEGMTFSESWKIRFKKSRFVKAFDQTALLHMFNQSVVPLAVLGGVLFLLGFYDISLAPYTVQVCEGGTCVDALKNLPVVGSNGDPYSLAFLVGLAICVAYYGVVYWRPLKHGLPQIMKIGVSRIGADVNSAKQDLVVERAWIWKSGYFIGGALLAWNAFYVTWIPTIDLLAVAVTFVVGVSIVMCAHYTTRIKSGRTYLEWKKTGTKNLKDYLYTTQPPKVEREVDLVFPVRARGKDIEVNPSYLLKKTVQDMLTPTTWADLVKIVATVGIAAMAVGGLESLHLLPELSFKNLPWLSEFDNLIYFILVVLAVSCLVYLLVQAGDRKLKRRKASELLTLVDALEGLYRRKAERDVLGIIERISDEIGRVRLGAGGNDLAGIVASEFKSGGRKTPVPTAPRTVAGGSSGGGAGGDASWVTRLGNFNAKTTTWHAIFITITLVSGLVPLVAWYDSQRLLGFAFSVGLSLFCLATDVMANGIKDRVDEALSVRDFGKAEDLAYSAALLAVLFGTFNAIVLGVKALMTYMVLRNREIDRPYEYREYRFDRVIDGLKRNFKRKLVPILIVLTARGVLFALTLNYLYLGALVSYGIVMVLVCVLPAKKEESEGDNNQNKVDSHE
ncbi:MAG: hypothetical protein ACTSU5_02765, partial [Promethearchaeota archaeon]